jgi:hypothetical protein
VSVEGIQAICQQGAHALAPVGTDMKLTPQTTLADGTCLADLRFWVKGYRRSQPRITLRVITYTLDDPQRNPDQRTFRLITPLLDPDSHPAQALIQIYHQRWEIEIASDEIDTHQRLTWTPIRSQKPVGVIQAFYALWLAYFVIWSLKYQSAEYFNRSPHRFSFINALRLIQHIIPITQLLWETHHSRLLPLFYQWQDYFLLPPREQRINPRVVKRKRNKFRPKKPDDHSIKVPPFAELIRLWGA